MCYLCGMKILTGTQFSELDRLTMEGEPIDSLDLMERASQAVAREVMQRWDDRRMVYVFCGPGNNGGDGLAVARIMVRHGYKVGAYLFNVTGRLSEECAANWDRLEELAESLQTASPRTGSLTLHEITQGFDFPRVRPCDVVIDALFGIGLKRPLNGGFAVVAKKINSTGAHVVSIDVPSGLMCEDNAYTDRTLVVHAELTLTMQVPKLAFLMGENEQCVGEWKVLDIGLLQEALDGLDSPYSIMEEAEVKDLLRVRPRFAHKGSMGHAMLVAGSYGMAGAAILASRACLRSGVGKLSLHTPACNNVVLQTAVPEAVLLLDANKSVVAETMDMTAYQAVGIGPGLGQDDHTAVALQTYLSLADDALVVDADALNILGAHREWLSHLPSGSILTPHPKELERLVGQCSTSVERLQRAQDLAVTYKVYVVLKGHYTALCMPSGRVMFCPLGNPGMATAGSGDVLTGILTSLLAQGYAPAHAAMLGVWLHASAGDLAAEELSEPAMLASDIVGHIGAAYRKLMQQNK